MIIDGRALAAQLYEVLQNEVSHLEVAPHLTVFTCAPNFETRKYLELKKRKAEQVGIVMNVIELPADIDTTAAVQSVTHAQMQTDGIVVQLPFPAQVDIDAVLQAVPVSYDVDAMHYDGTDTKVLPPVVGAIKTIVDAHDILLATQKVVIVGRGRLVGAPAELWLQKQGASVAVVTEHTKDKELLIAAADVLVLGAGKPGLIVPEMIKDGVLIFDGGTSEVGGELVGDAEPACAKKASVFTPVPGGIGPLTIAILLKNLVRLQQSGNSK